jgi:hypothetical protein
MRNDEPPLAVLTVPGANLRAECSMEMPSVSVAVWKVVPNGSTSPASKRAQDPPGGHRQRGYRSA